MNEHERRLKRLEEDQRKSAGDGWTFLVVTEGRSAKDIVEETKRKQAEAKARGWQGPILLLEIERTWDEFVAAAAAEEEGKP